MQPVGHEFTINTDQTPFARLWPDSIVCPYCGDSSTLLSLSDIREDDGRVDLYCSNPQCDIRMFTIIAMTKGEPNQRNDVKALEMVDSGVGSKYPSPLLKAYNPEASTAHKNDIFSRRVRSL
jgi:hypothetical protein